uniref:Uncharacterized protein n=1 Tax=Panagrolaimus sp. PS1159 TaxID=55785 RepID=A0AC35GME3_9BILA
MKHYFFIFEFQRLLLAITRARKATFVIGSADLLKCCPEWESLIEMTAENFVPQADVPEQCLVQTKQQREERQQRNMLKSQKRKYPFDGGDGKQTPPPSYYKDSSLYYNERFRRPRQNH